MNTNTLIKWAVACVAVMTVSVSGLAVGLGTGLISLKIDMGNVTAITGANGVDGVDGSDGADGVDGTDGANSSNGSGGTDGAAGVNGADGANGSRGPAGAAGSDGTDGANGVNGTNGLDGVDGANGLNGTDGVDGVVSASAPLMYDLNGRSLSLDLDNFSHLAGLGYLQFDVATTATNAPGRMTWNATDGTIDLQLKDGLVTLQIGQENVQPVKNSNGGTLLDGRAVRVSGSAQGRITVEYGDNSSPTLSTSVVGILTEDIASGSEGYVTTYGLVRALDTSAWAAGSILYLSTNGQLTTTYPTNGRVVELGYVVVSDATAGSVFVNPRQSLDPIIGTACVVPGQVGSGVYNWHNLAGARWIIVCDY
ncbi:MAG: hypothetical protein RIS25_791 [Actinomycetota bacterium]|jgi:hypothetical protein